MGRVATISHDTWPRQVGLFGRRVDVCFHYNTAHRVLGRIVRDDAEEPYQTIILLDDGRVVLAAECQFNLLPQEKEPT